MLEDVIVVLSSAISAVFVVMSVILLARYRKLVSTTNESTRLARDLWDALEARSKSQNEKIIDLMARVELYGVQLGRQAAGEVGGIVRPQVSVAASREPEMMKEEVVEAPAPGLVEVVARELKEARAPGAGVALADTEVEVLKALADGPKTSVEINRLIERSREHTARLLKTLFENRLVERDARKKPFVYRLTQEGRGYLENASG